MKKKRFNVVEACIRLDKKAHRAFSRSRTWFAVSLGSLAFAGLIGLTRELLALPEATLFCMITLTVFSCMVTALLSFGEHRRLQYYPKRHDKMVY